MTIWPPFRPEAPQPICRASNTVTGAIPGVTFQLLSVPAAAENVQIQITNANSAVETAVQGFATAYNTVIKDINTQESKDSSGKPNPLFGTSTLALIQQQLQGALISPGASGSINNLAQLGLSLASDGTLTFSSSALDKTLNTNYGDVLGFLQNTGSFGQTLYTTPAEIYRALIEATAFGALTIIRGKSDGFKVSGG